MPDDLIAVRHVLDHLARGSSSLQPFVCNSDKRVLRRTPLRVPLRARIDAVGDFTPRIVSLLARHVGVYVRASAAFLPHARGSGTANPCRRRE